MQSVLWYSSLTGLLRFAHCECGMFEPILQFLWQKVFLSLEWAFDVFQNLFLISDRDTAGVHRSLSE